MGTLFCQRCGAQADGKSQKEADDKIDHARGQMIGRPCSGKQSDLHWTGSQKTKEELSETPVVEETIAITESKSSKKTKKSKRG